MHTKDRLRLDIHDKNTTLYPRQDYNTIYRYIYKKYVLSHHSLLDGTSTNKKDRTTVQNKIWARV